MSMANSNHALVKRALLFLTFLFLGMLLAFYTQAAATDYKQLSLILFPWCILMMVIGLLCGKASKHFGKLVVGVLLVLFTLSYVELAIRAWG